MPHAAGQKRDRCKGCGGKLNKSGIENRVGQHTSGIPGNHGTASKKSDSCKHRCNETEGKVRVTKGPIREICRSAIQNNQELSFLHEISVVSVDGYDRADDTRCQKNLITLTGF